MTVISESGLYKMVMRSNKPEARLFQDWVTQVVLPAIRKDGAYILGEEKVATGESGLKKQPLGRRPWRESYLLRSSVIKRESVSPFSCDVSRCCVVRGWNTKGFILCVSTICVLMATTLLLFPLPR